MSSKCQSVYSKLNFGNLKDSYAKLTSSQKREVDICLEEKYNKVIPKCDTMTNLFDNYDNELQKNETANELNEQSKYLYISNLMYLIFKIFLFVILGYFYLIYIKKPEVVTSIKETIETIKPH